MALLVLAYPTVAESDWAWMQQIRAGHDQRYLQVVDPHFTLVFPVFDLAVEPFVDHVLASVQGQSPIPFVVRCATVVKDVLSDDSHVFLVPDEGHSGVVKLHDRLYTGLLRSQLRLDIPFIPHIGVATSVDIECCKSVADALNAQDFTMAGVIDRLDIVCYENNTVTTIRPIQLTPLVRQ
jgi:2'-5' RNA ligase